MIDLKVFTLVFFALCCMACYWLIRHREGITFISASASPEKPFIGFQPNSDSEKDEINDSA